MLRRALAALALALPTLAVGGAAGASPDAALQQRDGPLTRIYRGDDGGILYLRTVGSTAYGFGEHPGRKYAYVLTGSVAGDRVTGTWWDVPKGTRTESGRLELRWSQGGARLVRPGGDDLGPDVFTAIPPAGIPWPNRQVAGFQATRRNDLDGVFAGDDASRHYVRETGGAVVWVAERASQPGERPGWASVFVGTRKGNGTGFSGTYADVPKGLERRSGNFGAALVTGKRELALAQPGAKRARRLAPDYAIDWQRFASELERRLDGNVVGYAYALGRGTGIMRSGAGGLRRLAIDGGARSFTTKTLAQTASAAKTINATAIVKALRDRGLSVDAKVAPFLPSCLKLGRSMSTLTFRQILSHTSGLPRVSCNGGSPYDCLVRMLAEGRTKPRQISYNTHAYDLLRWLVPLVNDRKGMQAQFELFDCENRSGILNRKVSAKFVRYVFDKVLKPVGARASHYPNPSGDFSLNYDFAKQSVKGEAPRTDFYERAGSGKLTMTVLDYVRFLGALEQGKIVPKSVVEAMKGSASGRLGFDNVYGGTAGSYVWKNGGCPDFERKGRGCATAAMILPSGIVAYVATNSTNNGYTGSIQSVLGASFDAALR